MLGVAERPPEPHRVHGAPRWHDDGERIELALAGECPKQSGSRSRGLRPCFALRRVQDDGPFSPGRQPVFFDIRCQCGLEEYTRSMSLPCGCHSRRNFTVARHRFNLPPRYRAAAIATSASTKRQPITSSTTIAIVTATVLAWWEHMARFHLTTDLREEPAEYNSVRTELNGWHNSGAARHLSHHYCPLFLFGCDFA